MRDVLFVSGLAVADYGLWLAWPPAPWIFTGVVLMAMALYGVAHRPQKQSPESSP